MSYNLFLDDERYPPADKNHWIVVRDYEAAVHVVQDRGLPGYISFDHDLGEGKTGYDFAKWLGEYVMDHDLNLDGFEFYVHSQNPIGKENIEQYLNGLKRVYG